MNVEKFNFNLFSFYTVIRLNFLRKEKKDENKNLFSFPGRRRPQRAARGPL